MPARAPEIYNAIPTYLEISAIELNGAYFMHRIALVASAIMQSSSIFPLYTQVLEELNSIGLAFIHF